jgi:hypothetical protein
MKLNLKSLPGIRLLRLHNVIKKALRINFLITFRIEIKAGKIKIILDLIPVQEM